MTTALRIPPLRTIVAICALGGSALLMTACSTTTGSQAEAAEAAPTTASPTDTASPSPTASLTKDQMQRRDLVSKTKVSWDKAAGTAVKEVSGGKLMGIELKAASQENSASPGTASPGTASPGTASPGTASPGTASPSSPAPAPSPGSPEWQAKVAAADGTVHMVDVDAADGKVFRNQAQPGQSADDRRKVADRLRKATQSPAQAVKAATDKKKGTVTGAMLDESDGKLVWAVDVVDTKDWKKTTYDVDAASGKIAREHTDQD
ncbi:MULTISPECIES: PepSY domain-containing protein [unclassified Streptomyces]|uniref:PepSY domain-containing protein n=1 Tax=unclassified Streptomyces TaxID=2593676 RepID=UPI000369F22A|nr:MULTISPECIES: PepSY domain-containing protein [unclassified Streptomyces]EYT80942.1 hypothetical protein CF54_22460 [Streptomyces sp. Tu 6176]